MRINVVVDDALMAKASRITGLTTYKAVLDQALRTLVELHGQGEVRALRGRLQWEVNPDRERRS